jgi:hypothetical protein
LAERAPEVRKGDVVFVKGEIEYREHKEKLYTSIKAYELEVFPKDGEKPQGGGSPSSDDDGSEDDLPF